MLSVIERKIKENDPREREVEVYIAAIVEGMFVWWENQNIFNTLSNRIHLALFVGFFYFYFEIPFVLSL